MSSALAIASVTAVLRDLLHDGLIDHDLHSTLGDIKVTTMSPDRIDISGDHEQSQLNLFLYQVTPNASWRNVGLPSRDAGGELISNAPLALNLHYLLTAYGAKDLHAEILLGYGMQRLHETPVLTRSAIRTSLAPPSQVEGDLTSQLKALGTSELAEQIEQIKIIPETPNTEEISRLWSALGAHYRPTVAYQASVVLIESKRATRSALPVRARNIRAVPFNQPVIEEIKSQAKAGDPILANQPIVPGQNLVIAGTGLRADEVTLNIGGIETTPSMVTENQIISAIPAELRAGVQGVQVIQRTSMEPPPQVFVRLVGSNLAAFILRPVIDPAQVLFAPDPSLPNIAGTVTVSVNPPVGDDQRVMLLLNELVPDATPPVKRSESYGFLAPSRVPPGPPVDPPGSSPTIAIPVKGVKAATYLVRVQVDGAESVLGADDDGRMIAPQVTIA